MKLAPSHLERLADLFSVAYRNSPGGLPQTLALVIAEADRLRWPDERDAAVIDPEVLTSVTDTVATAHGVTRGGILGPSQRRELTAARAECWVILARLQYSLRAIGHAFEKDHGGIRAAIRRYEKVVASSAAVRARVVWLAQGKQRRQMKWKRGSAAKREAA